MVHRTRVGDRRDCYPRRLCQFGGAFSSTLCIALASGKMFGDVCCLLFVCCLLLLCLLFAFSFCLERRADDAETDISMPKNGISVWDNLKYELILFYAVPWVP